MGNGKTKLAASNIAILAVMQNSQIGKYMICQNMLLQQGNHLA
jgi:hypothetical protein